MSRLARASCATLSALGVALTLLASCSSNDGGHPADRQSGGVAGLSATGGSETGVGGSGGAQFGLCADAAACPDGLIRDLSTCECWPCIGPETCADGGTCDPTTHTCGVYGCTTHADCGRSAYCGPDGLCLQSTDSDGPCEANENCHGGGVCMLGYCGGCGVMRYSTEPVAPNVLIVLDRSDSMNEALGTTTKWDAARSALNKLASGHEAVLRFGLMLYPGQDVACQDDGAGGADGAACEPGTVLLDPGLDQAEDLSNLLDQASTCTLGTPTAETLATLDSYAGLASIDRNNYVVLITDGKASCGDPVAAVQALRAAMPEVKTIVVGFGDAVNTAELEAMAVAGGMARSEAPSYYQADSAAALDAVLESIVLRVFPCTVNLSEDFPGAAPTPTYVWFDAERVPQDTTHTNGWDVDTIADELTFYGDACEQLSKGEVKYIGLIATECSER